MIFNHFQRFTITKSDMNYSQVLTQLIKMSKLWDRTRWPGFERRIFHLWVRVSMIIYHFVHLQKEKSDMNL